ncbi:respiratory nitrate reductase chaperone NarJ [Tahibacter aquaticus]|uniref:Respiratory nitrate reductase chaperone NarJ n=1 Tax=Tahibacter aquaticus TaxID=520092 RepID=A0A4R6YMB2_9GAMM|nr:nitrate reductase molybdenum cofactor assembly chaperone [Tahibacter aquaticus]TDR38559.1 respiratory nitrate reductase chaperone NarJ [Tahibacter aquaticus]
MKVLKLVGVLLDYPQEELWSHRDALLQACVECALPPASAHRLQVFAQALLALEPMAAQERWLGLFDRGRAMSLLLFEHIHGESRDRGQAMVDLIETYRRGGLELDARELPDYLPLVLEYLSGRPEAEVVDWLGHVAQIVALLAGRAAERESPYATLLEILVEISQGKVDLALMRRKARDETRDDTPEAIDRVWEEEAVRFGVEPPQDECSPPRRLPAGAHPHESQVSP